MQPLLNNTVLAIPPIEDILAANRLIETKTILSDLLGFDSGLFYELLAANAHTDQFY
ncbi:MAG: hypothetical protein LBG15_08980 [Dysgonamonadaceae bacterium]|jgi:hypothetical protein|nr:hypothetical protein [Dysgonamonadaceae bacterium]